MKKLILLLCISIVFFSCSNKEDGPVIFNGNIQLETQEQINEFGANGYQEINGNLTIIDGPSFDNTVDLSPLNSILIVTGSLNISGLSNLETIELQVTEVGTLFIVIVDSETVSFPALTKTTSGFFRISDCPALRNMNFPNLETVFSRFQITDNVGIRNLDGFPSLTNIGQNSSSSTGVDSELSVSGNPFLQSISGLSNVTSDIISLQIESNDMLTSLNGLENARFNRAISIIFNNILTDFCAIRTTVSNGVENYDVAGNQFNPSNSDMMNNNCSE